MKQKYLLIILLIFLTSNLFGQQVFPELTKKITGISDSTVIFKIEQIYHQELGKKSKDILLLKFWKYTLYDSLGFEDLSDTMCIELLPHLDKIHHKKTADIYSFIGNKLYDDNLYEQGISTLHKGLNVSKKYNDYMRTSLILKDIGVAYRKLGDLKNAKKYLKEALYYAFKTKDNLQIGNVYLALGNALREGKDNKNALIYFQKSLEIGQKINSSRLLAGNYNNIGLIEHDNSRYKIALNYFYKALKINVEGGNKLWESFNYLNMGNTYDKLKQYDMAIQCYQKSNTLKMELGDSLMLLTGYTNIADVYYDSKDYKNGYLYLKKYVKLKDTLNIMEQSNLLNDLEAKYESDKKQAEIKHLKMSSELQKVKNESLKMQNHKNRNISILSILVAISLSVGLGILWRTNTRRKQDNNLLNVKNSEIESANYSLQDALSKLSIKNTEVIDSINYATYIQQASLPNISQLSSDLLHFELFFAPKDIVSGDFYFLYQLYKKTVFGVADCTGHGVPGAMVSLVGMNSLDKVVREENHFNSSSMVESLNEHVIESLQRGKEAINDGMDISFCYLNHEDNILHFTGANHSVFIIRKTVDIDFDNENEKITVREQQNEFSFIQLEGTKRPIGKSLSKESFTEVRFNVKKEDRIVLFSDGFADQIGGESKKKFKKGTLRSLLLESSHLAIKEQMTFMKKKFESWKGENEQTDDICLLIVNVE